MEGKADPDKGARETEISKKGVGERAKRYWKLNQVASNAKMGDRTLFTSPGRHRSVVDMDNYRRYLMHCDRDHLAQGASNTPNHTHLLSDWAILVETTRPPSLSHERQLVTQYGLSDNR